MENVGSLELVVILLVVLIFFGPRKIPELAASLGKGLRKFNAAKENLEGQIKTTMKEPMDSINEAKAGFQKKMTEMSAPIREVVAPALTIAEPSVSTPAPIFTPPEGSVPHLDVAVTPEGSPQQPAPEPPPQVPTHEA
jgi:TatA/E family protein of Tat protein translocase